MTLETPKVEKTTLSGSVKTMLATWPALPYLGLGVWLLWPLMAFSGGIWLSDLEVNGENISRLTIASSLAFGLTCLAAGLFEQFFSRWINARGLMVLSALLGAFGSLLIIVSGPYYLVQFMGYNAFALFYAGGVLTGVASGLLVLRCGYLYAALNPRWALRYAAFAHILLAFLFFLVLGTPSWAPIAGGPSLGGILAFVVAMPVAAGLLCLPSSAPSASTQAESAAQEPQRSASLPRAFWKLLVTLLLFSLLVSLVRAIAIGEHPVDVTFGGSAIIMLLRVFFACVVVVLAMGKGLGRLNYGKIYSLIALALVIAIAVLPMIGVLDSFLNLIISTCLMIFEFVLFCLLVLICYRRQADSTKIIGLGYGVYMLGSTLGWILALSGITSYIEPQMVSVFYLVIAGIVLLLTFFLYSEKDFERLFNAVGPEDKTLLEVLTETNDEPLPGVLQGNNAEASTGGGANGPTQRRFITALELLAAEQDLSPRETEVFKYLAMGRGADYIAEQLTISWNTVRTHTQNIYTKVGVHSRNELMDLVDALKRQ